MRVNGFRWSRGAVLIACLGVLAACDNGPAVPHVAVILPSSDNPFWQDMARGAAAVGDSIGQAVRIDVLSGSADTDARGQSESLRTLLAEGSASPSALVLGPASATAVVPIIAQYNARGIPVIVVDSKLDSVELARANAHVDYFLGSENREGGRLAAERIATSLGARAASVLVLAGSPDHETALARGGGFRDAAPSTWNIREVPANWSRAEANRVVQAVAQQTVPDAIFAANDEMALGAVSALESVGVPPARWPVIVGFDATPDGRAAIQAGKMCASIAQQPQLIGRRAVVVALQYAGGTKPTRSVEAIPVTIVEDSTRAPCRHIGRTEVTPSR